MSMLSRLAEVPAGPTQSVTNSVEFQRVAGLPRRQIDFATALDCTELVRKPGGTKRLFPIQSVALAEAARMNGLFGIIRCGGGKTLLSLLLPVALDSERAVILTKSTLKAKTLREIERDYAPHFNIPVDKITIVAYEELSDASGTDILDDLKPDLIVADEAHALRNLSGSKASVRGKRFVRYVQENPATRYAFLSGTITSRSIKDYARLLEYALRKNSPLPRHYREINDWAGAIDVNPEYEMKPGVLKQFCADGETVREGYRRRLIQSPGVVASPLSELGASLIIQQLAPKVPAVVQQKLAEVRRDWALDGDEFEQAIEVVSALRQIACGFYYRWKWPNDVVDTEWLQARSDWHREVREQLKRSTKGMDSPELCARAAERHWKLVHEGKKSEGKQWPAQSWAAWREQRHKPPPPNEAVWISSFLVDEALTWGKQESKKGGAIIWYEHNALGDAFARRGIPTYGAGTDASTSTAPLIACSTRAQGTGKNLQTVYSRNLFTTMPFNGAAFEQYISRTYREGQPEDEVTCDWYGHTDETRGALESILADAHYADQSAGQQYAVLRATIT